MVISDVFESLGYEVNLEGRMEHQEYWWELSKDDRLVAQVDLNVPLETLQRDFAAWLKGEEGSSEDSYVVNGDIEDPNFREFLQKVVGYAQN